MKPKTIDMTQGTPWKLMVRFAVPMMIGSMFQSLYMMVDSAVLGKYVGSQALAAIGATTSTTSFVLLFATAVTSAISIIMSQYVGSGDKIKVKKTLVSSIYITILLAIVLGSIGVFAARPLMVLLGTPSEIINDSVLYIQLICGFGIAQFAYNTVAAVLRSLGDSKTPLYFLILCSILNVILDLFAVLKMNMGVSGVAFATIVSQAISAAVCIVFMFKKFPELKLQKSDWRLDIEIAKQTFSMGIQMALQSTLLGVGQMVITAVINSYGSNVVAAYTVGTNIQNLAVMLFSNFSFGFSVYVGQNYGAKQGGRIKRGVKEIFILVGILSFIACILCEIFANFLVSLYVNSSETEVLKASLSFVRIESVFFPFLAWIWLYLSTLKGMGKIAITFLSSITELVCKIGFSILLPIWMGYNGIWISAPLGWILGILPIAIYYYIGKWEKDFDKV